MRATCDFYDYQLLSVSSEDELWPKENLQEYTSSTLSWKSEDTAQTTIVIDLSIAVANPSVLLYRTNFTSFKIQGHTSDLWTGPAFDSGTLTIAKDYDHDIYKRTYLPTTFNHRYMRILIPTQTPTDGQSNFEIGVLAIFQTLENFSQYASGFLQINPEKVIAEEVHQFETGRKEIIPLEEIPILPFNFEGTMEESAENERRVNEVFMNPLKSLVYIDLEKSHSTAKIYLLQRVGMMQIPAVPPRARRVSIALETIL